MPVDLGLTPEPARPLASGDPSTATVAHVRESVREKYAAVAAASGVSCCATADDAGLFGSVIDLSGDKPVVLAQAARVLRPGGRFAVSDVIADADMDEQTSTDMQARTGCITGALTREEFAAALAAAGLVDAEIREAHLVHEHAVAAIIRARKPA
jgi:threonine dehydrogenase-like Zn-dependent dehydrogenase